jgi:hypothetical protein
LPVQEDQKAVNELPALQERLAKLSSDELLEMVTVHFRGYRKEALAFARAELNRRGFPEADIRSPSKDFIEERQPDRFPSRLSSVAFPVGVGLITFALFPALVYYSIVVYGLMASIFMTVGYVIWCALMRTNPRKAMSFSIGFLAPVLLILGLYFTAVPWLVLAIVGEFLVFSFTFRLWWAGRR